MAVIPNKKFILKIREEAKKLNPIDDLSFKKMAEDKDFCEEMVQTFLFDNQIRVLTWKPQFAGTNLQGRSVVIDLVCTLKGGKRSPSKSRRKTMTTSRSGCAMSAL